MSFIAVASHNRHEISGHTGKCRRFWLYEIRERKVKGKRLLELGRDQALYACKPALPHPLDAAKVVISGGIGAGLIARLHARGIAAVVTDETNPDLAVKDYLAGQLARARPTAPAQPCSTQHCRCRTPG